MIENMGIAWIDPHPDNPRKDLGDLTELVASIKANGILQNLTVVKAAVGYRVVIGHRRLAAAKLAGLLEVPCAISDMDHRQQVATMLTENMQRSDLTIYEQAKGLQMLLDFGESLDTIAKQTGFSETTIRRRVKLLELDPEKLKQAVTRSATLQDYVELEQIKSLESRNSVLESIGTSEFRWKLKAAIDQEKKEQLKAALIDKLKTFATEVSSDKGLSLAKYLSYANTDPETCVPDDAGQKQYFFIAGNYDARLLEKEVRKSEKDSAQENFYDKRRERCSKLDEANQRARQLRKEFVQWFRPSKQQRSIVMEFAVRTFVERGSNYLRNEYLLELLEIEPIDGKIGFEQFQEVFNESPDRLLFVTAYGNMDSPSEKFHDWEVKHKTNPTLETVYDMLERLGYQISHEELQLIDGTHELYEEGTP
jgi:ParB family transcriptional regulator, chromosome partitioning protein